MNGIIATIAPPMAMRIACSSLISILFMIEAIHSIAQKEKNHG